MGPVHFERVGREIFRFIITLTTANLRHRHRPSLFITPADENRWAKTTTPGVSILFSPASLLPVIWTGGWPCKCVADDTIRRYSAQLPYPLEKKRKLSLLLHPNLFISKKGRTKSRGRERERLGGCLRTSGSYRSIERGNRDYLLLSTAVRGCGRVSRLFVSLAIDSNQSASPPHSTSCAFFPYKPRVLTRRRRRPLSPRRNSVAAYFSFPPIF